MAEQLLNRENAQPQPRRFVKVHPLTVRITHWINALAVIMMIMSGLQIYDASPIFRFSFPSYLTLGGWLAGGILWHFAIMWILAINGLIYLLYGIFTGHFKHDFFPVRWRDLLTTLKEALFFKLSHADLTVYNAVQRAAYIGVILVLILQIATGLAIWKPVQFQQITAFFGGYDQARVWHFVGMSLLVLFIFIHVLLVILVPRTFLPMWTGRLRIKPARNPALQGATRNAPPGGPDETLP